MCLSLKSKGFIVILSSPSGAGKSSLSRALLKIDNNLKLSVSVTTRKPRKAELDGVNYYFKTKEEFKNLIKQNKFIEYAKIYDNYYGTLKQSVQESLKQDLTLLFDIDWQGAESIKKLIPNVVTIFIVPPSLDILKQRINDRGQDSIDVINLRMKLATKEIIHAKEYDYVIVNDDFDNSLMKIYSIVTTERMKKEHLNLDEFLLSLIDY